MLRSLVVTVTTTSGGVLTRPLEAARRTSTVTKAHLRKWVKALQTEGVPEPQLAVRHIVEHLLARKATRSHVSTDTDDLIGRAESMVMKRRHRVPLQYIIGEWDFRNLTLKMRPPVLIPRPETEQLTGHVIATCQSSSSDNDGRLWFLDVGCGSGAISISLLQECPKLRGVAIDASAEAVKLTRENAQMNRVHERLHVTHLTIGEASLSSDAYLAGRSFDILVCNPPYIPSHAIQGLDPEVLWFEDHLALDGGYDGLRVTAQVLEASRSIVKKGGHIWLELTADQDLRQLIEHNSHWQLMLLQSYSDFTGKILFHHLVNGHT